MGTTADFLGIEFNSNLIQARLPPDKLARARNTAKDLLNKLYVSHQELESAVGFLSFASKVVVPGKAFLRRLYNALRRLVRLYIITSCIKADLQWWLIFLNNWDGLKLLRNMDDRPTWYVWTDALGNYGMRGYILNETSHLLSPQDVFSIRVSIRHRHKDIQFKEMKAVYHAI